MRRVIVGVGLIVVALSGCSCGSTQTKERTQEYALPPELRDCKVFKLESESALDLWVVRCRESWTSTNWAVSNGKSTSYYMTGSN